MNIKDLENLFEKFKMELREELKNDLATNFQTLESNITSMKTEIEKIKKSRNINRRITNIIVHKLEEKSNRPDIIEQQVTDFLNENLEMDINLSELNYVKRIGAKLDGRVRPVLVSFVLCRRRI